MPILFKSLLITILLVCALFADEQKINIAALDLNGTGINTDEVLFLSNRLRTELFETGVFNVLEREQMNTILNEQGFQQSGCTTIDCAVEIGQLLNVQQMVAGSIGKIEDIFSITLRLIDVQTGAIIKTATQDHSGKLSTMLTDVIPAVARILATDENKQIESSETEVPELNNNMNVKKSGFIISIKGGLAFAVYTSEINDKINVYNQSSAIIDLPEYSNLSNFALEIGYFLSQDWQLKLGVAGFPQIEEWNYKINESRFKRTYNFSNVYFGFNYYFWTVKQNTNFFVGFDIGSFEMNAETDIYSETLNEFDGKWQNNYETTRFGSKLSLGGVYSVGKFHIGAEFTIRMMGTHFTRTKDPLISTDLFEIVFPREINATGTQLSLIVSYEI
jgi:hypothetical protein